MKKLSITFGTILLVLGCFAFSPAAKADQPIVGLWHNHFVSDSSHHLKRTRNGIVTDWKSRPQILHRGYAWGLGHR
jgi:hypothetical protein